ncbi:MAG: MarR family winged helix-turn-helix transcriptional regulator [Pseudomonadota bacterium]
MTRSPRAGYDLVDSRSLALAQSVGGFQTRLMAWLLRRLAEDGFLELSAAQLSFLGALDCGETHAASLARELGVSRQAVHKQVRELSAAGWLEMKEDPQLGNQKVILFTVEGERMMAAARSAFAALDQQLGDAFSEADLAAAAAVTGFDPGR